jgi:uncharacterized repeat protein (TIGR03803 family)
MKTIRRLLLVTAIVALMFHHANGAVIVETMYTFGHNTNANGAGPWDLIKSQDGNFYGTTQYGGPNGYGTVFKLTTVRASCRDRRNESQTSGRRKYFGHR